MENMIKRLCPASEYRYALLGYGYEPYRIVRITKLERGNDYEITLELKK